MLPVHFIAVIVLLERWRVVPLQRSSSPEPTIAKHRARRRFVPLFSALGMSNVPLCSVVHRTTPLSQKRLVFSISPGVFGSVLIGRSI